MLERGYFRAKIVQDDLIKNSSIPHSLVRATQFYEFVEGIADFSTDGNKVRLPPVLLQSIAVQRCGDCRSQNRGGPSLYGTFEIKNTSFYSQDFCNRNLFSASSPTRATHVVA
jgi:hypothetical protein